MHENDTLTAFVQLIGQFDVTELHMFHDDPYRNRRARETTVALKPAYS